MSSLIDRLAQGSIPEPNSGCLLWIGGYDHYGYGQLHCDGGPKKAHRLAWSVANGPVPSGMGVLHKCDVRECINPNHLFLGTQRDNMADMRAKGRVARGDIHYRAKLTSEQVAAIRSDSRSQKEIAATYGITQGHVSGLRSGKKWAFLAAML